MKTTMRDAVVNCRPTKMQKNSAAKSAPASSPPASVPSRSSSAMPRPRAQSQTRIAAPLERSVACQSAGTSGSAAFAATWFRPQRKQQSDEQGDGHGVEMRLALGRIPDAMLGTDCSLPAALPSLRERAPDSFGVPFDARGVRIVRRRAATAIAPATRPLACANGAVAMSQPAGWRSAGPHGVSLATLIVTRGEEQRADRAPRAALVPEQTHAATHAAPA